MALATATAGTLSGQEKLIASKDKTTLSWLGEKVVGQHSGTIDIKSGHLTWLGNKIASGEFVIDMPSIKSDEKLDRLVGHLKSEDFFGVDNHPESRLEITDSTPFDKGTGTVKGKLTIKNITHPVEFRATVQKAEEGHWFYANLVIDRSKYNIRYGSGSFFDNLGDKTIYDEFKIKVNLFVGKS